MRKTKTILAIAALLMTGTIMTSCSKEESTNMVEKNQLTLKAASAMPDCEEVFIVNNTPVFRTDSEVINWGSKKDPKTKTVNISYGNDLTHFYIVVSSTEGFSDLVIDGVSSWLEGPVGPNEEATYSYLLPEGWEPCDMVNHTLQVVANGPPAYFTVEYALLGEDLLCTESFSYSYIGNNTYTFFYKPIADFTIVDVKFTFPQAVEVSGLSGFTQNGNGNSSVWSKNMDLSACEQVSFTVTLIGESGDNLFTDFKVGGFSKKGNVGNIIMP